MQVLHLTLSAHYHPAIKLRAGPSQNNRSMLQYLSSSVFNQLFPLLSPIGCIFKGISLKGGFKVAELEIRGGEIPQTGRQAKHPEIKQFFRLKDKRSHFQDSGKSRPGMTCLFNLTP